MTAKKAEALFEEISAYIAQSHVLLKDGALLELNGLDGRIQKLCEAVLTLSQDERVQYSDKLQMLFKELHQLGADMAQIRDVIADDLRNISDHRKANVAYKVADNVDAKKGEN